MSAELTREQRAILERFAAIMQMARDDAPGGVPIPAVVDRIDPDALSSVTVHRCR